MAGVLTANGGIVGDLTGDVTGNLTGNVTGTADNCSRSVNSGAGLTGGGLLNADHTLIVGAGDGITVGDDAVGVDSTVVRTSGDQTITNTKTFSNDVVVSGTLSVRTAIDLADNDILRLGSGDDAELFCNGSHLYLDLNSGIGNFYIRDGTTARYTFDDNGTLTCSTVNAALNSTNVANAIAAHATGIKGSYGSITYDGASATLSPGTTKSGSSLRWGNGAGNWGGSVARPSGSWRLNGRIGSNSDTTTAERNSLWLRYS